MRLFYSLYSKRFKALQIPQTLSAELPQKQKTQTLSAKSTLVIPRMASRKSFADVFPLSWSHYVLLCRIENEGERRFYEIECTQGHWGFANCSANLMLAYMND
jgi:hypothetical protein